jgi:hypothetical protein
MVEWPYPSKIPFQKAPQAMRLGSLPKISRKELEACIKATANNLDQFHDVTRNFIKLKTLLVDANPTGRIRIREVLSLIHETDHTTWLHVGDEQRATADPESLIIDGDCIIMGDHDNIGGDYIVFWRGQKYYGQQWAPELVNWFPEPPTGPVNYTLETKPAEYYD